MRVFDTGEHALVSNLHLSHPKQTNGMTYMYLTPMMEKL